jgi:hypothetical protein
MNGYLRQSTASQARVIGPFVDDTDFKTSKTALTIANTDIKLRANGTTLANKASVGGTHQVNGLYSVTWDATDTANAGELFYSVVVASALQVFGSYVVLPAATYDAMFASGADAMANLANLDEPVSGLTTDMAFIQADTNDIQNRLPAALTAAGNLKADAQVVSDKTGYDLSVAARQAIWDALTSALSTANSIGKALVDACVAITGIKATTDKVDTILEPAIGGSSRLTTGSFTQLDKTGYRLSAAGVDDILDEVVEGTKTLRQSMRLANAANGGKLNGAATTTINIRDVDDTKNRVASTVDANGNRTAVTLDLT